MYMTCLRGFVLKGSRNIGWMLSGGCIGRGSSFFSLKMGDVIAEGDILADRAN